MKSEEATHFVKLNVGSRATSFWLDPFAQERGKVRGNDGWDEQCPTCGESINEGYEFTKDGGAIKCPCGQTLYIFEG